MPDFPKEGTNTANMKGSEFYGYGSAAPTKKLGSSPVEQWNCSYCPYYDHCEPPYIKRK